MNDELAELRSQLDRLNDEFRSAQRTIQRLEKRPGWRRPNIATLIVVLIAAGSFVSSWRVNASPGNERNAPLLADLPTKVKAPFEVDDDNGIPIMVVRDQANQDANVGRGVYVMDQSRKAVVRMGTTDDDGGGGMIMVTETGPMMTSTGAQVNGIQIIGTQEKSTMQVVRGGKKVASIGAEQGEKGGIENGGSVQVFGANEKAIATLSKGKNGGELNVFDAKNKKAATLAGDTGGGMLRIFGSSDKPKATLGTEADNGSLKIYGSNESPVATLQSEVGDGKLWIGNKEGKTVAGVFANNNGGVVKVMRNGDPTTYTSMSAIDLGMGLAIRISDVRKTYVGTNGEGNGAVYVYSHGDDPVAGLSTYGSGKGVVSVFSNNIAIAFMAENDKHPGGGNFTATDPNGVGIFSAGFTGEGGDACIDRKNGLKCLGIGLPLQINP